MKLANSKRLQDIHIRACYVLKTCISLIFYSSSSIHVYTMCCVRVHPLLASLGPNYSGHEIHTLTDDPSEPELLNKQALLFSGRNGPRRLELLNNLMVLLFCKARPQPNPFYIEHYFSANKTHPNEIGSMYFTKEFVIVLITNLSSLCPFSSQQNTFLWQRSQVLGKIHTLGKIVPMQLCLKLCYNNCLKETFLKVLQCLNM